MQSPEDRKYDVSRSSRGATGSSAGFDPASSGPCAQGDPEEPPRLRDVDYVISRFRHEAEAVGRSRTRASPDLRFIETDDIACIVMELVNASRSRTTSRR